MDYPRYPMAMEEEVVGFRAPVQPWPWHWQWHLFSLLASTSPARRPAADHVRWEETAAAHLFSANLPGVRKEEIRVEVEDARYLVIRTEPSDSDADGDIDRRRNGRSFDRKFRLPGMVDADGISAEYTRGVLTVTIPRMHTRASAAHLFGAADPPRDSAARAA